MGDASCWWMLSHTCLSRLFGHRKLIMEREFCKLPKRAGTQVFILFTFLLKEIVTMNIIVIRLKRLHHQSPPETNVFAESFSPHQPRSACKMAQAPVPSDHGGLHIIFHALDSTWSNRCILHWACRELTRGNLYTACSTDDSNPDRGPDGARWAPRGFGTVRRPRRRLSSI